MNNLKKPSRKKLISNVLFFVVVVGWLILLGVNYYIFGRIYNTDKKIFLALFFFVVVPVAIWSIKVDHDHTKNKAFS